MILKQQRQWLNAFRIVLIMSVCTVRAHVSLETVLAQLSTSRQIPPQQVVSLFWSLSCYDTHAFLEKLMQQYLSLGYDYQANVRMIHHCRAIHRFMKHLYVDENRGDLCYKERQPSPSFPSIIQFWQAHQQYAYLDWYRLYADALSVVLIQELQRAYASRGTSEYKDHSARAHMYYNEFKDIYTLFAGTVYEITYTQAVRRYLELLSLMRV